MTDAGPFLAGRSVPKLIWINARRGIASTRGELGAPTPANDARRPADVGCPGEHTERTPGNDARRPADVGCPGEHAELTLANDARPLPDVRCPGEHAELTPANDARSLPDVRCPGEHAELTPDGCDPRGRSHPRGRSTQSSPGMDANPRGRSHPRGRSTQSSPGMDAIPVGIDLQAKLACGSTWPAGQFGPELTPGSSGRASPRPNLDSCRRSHTSPVSSQQPSSQDRYGVPSPPSS